MLGRLYPGQDCSAARALELVGERWSLLIMRDAMFRGAQRFSDFQRWLDIAPNILSRRLEGFVAAGLMQRGEQGEYLLTEKGLDLKAVVVALTHWGDTWLEPGPVVFVESSSGAIVEQRFVDGTRAVVSAEVKAIRRS